MAAYLTMMRAAPDARGGLGIGRVAAEAEMKVTVAVLDNVVVVRAELEDVA
jgi:hypothetical protein